MKTGTAITVQIVVEDSMCLSAWIQWHSLSTFTKKTQTHNFCKNVQIPW